jgi:selenocysteine lyase/cysteine desulfurase
LSSGLAKLLPALPATAERTVLPASAERTVLLAAEDSFPSLGFVLQRAGGSGLSARFIPRNRDPSSIATWADAIAADVSAVLLMHAYSNTGLIAPVAEIAALCRERGVLCIVDIAQSAGILPLSVREFGADVVLGSCVKWLCGGPGAGFMWISPARVAQLTPADVGWFSHANPFEFDIHAFRYAADARRFWGGTPSVAPYAIAAESIRLIAEIGVNEVRSHNRRLMEVFRAELPPPWRSKIDLGRIGGTICLQLGDSLADIRRSLQASFVRVDYRGQVVRISFHIYNTEQEAAAVARCWAGVPA